MRKPALRRKIVMVVAMALLAAIAFALAVVLFSPLSASASATSSKSRTTATKRKAAKKPPARQATKKKHTTKKTKKGTKTSPTATTPTSPLQGPDSAASDPESKAAAKYFVINGTANAASDHEIVGSSAFPNYTTGAVDNYYSLAHTHVDNSPFAEGTASPADTGPIGQTAAAGNFQQPQYADARWPGDSGKATYGTQGQPYAKADASPYTANAESSEAENGFSSPPGPTVIASPKGFDGRLRKALAAWRETWLSRLEPKRPKPTIKPPTLTVTTPVGKITTPTVSVPTPSVTVPLGGVKVTPPVPVPSAPSAPSAPVPAPVPAPAPPVPSALAPHSVSSSRSLSSASGDGGSLLHSISQVTIDAKTGALLTSGESSLGRVSIGGGQILIDGIHVTASITNDGKDFKNKTSVTVGAATIGGVPVSIDQDGVHIAGQTQGLPYQQASDALNGALKQAGIQLFIVNPEITNNSCGQSGTSPTSTGTTSTGSTTTPAPKPPTSTDQTGTNPSSGSCGPGSMDSSSGSCGQADTSPTTTSSGPLPTPPTTTSRTTTNRTTTTTSTDQTSTNSSSGSCDQSGTTPTAGSCPSSGTATTTSSTDQGSTTTDTTSTDQSGGGFGFGFGPGAAGSGAGEETVTATGLHVLFTQPVDQSGVPAQFAEHILGEVFLDSLAAPAPPMSASNLGFSSSGFGPSSGSGSSTGSSSGFSSGSCGAVGGKSHTSKTSGFSSNGTGSSSAGGSSSSGSSSLTSGSGSTSSQGGTAAGLSGGGTQATSGTTGGGGQSLPARIVSALKKPLWLLLAYLVWQALVIGTGASLWRWRRGGTA